MTRIAVTGATGLVGSSLVSSLGADGHQVARLVRPGSSSGRDPAAVAWDPRAASPDLSPLEGFDAVVHLAGKNIADGRWSEAMKREIRESRVLGTGGLATGLAKLSKPPRVLVCASAIGFYGDRGEEILTEKSPPGSGFLGSTCREWEEAAEPARKAGIRVVHLRIGVVLSRAGGALAKMYLPFWLGLGGRVGSGRQWMSWVTRLDVVRAIRFALDHPELSGPANLVAPGVATNAEFTRALGKALGRPTIFPIPELVVSTVFGEMGRELLLGSTRVVPEVLAATGFRFEHPDLATALPAALADRA